MSKYAIAHSVTEAKRLREWLREAGQGADVIVFFRDGRELSGTRTYLGTVAFGLRQEDGSRTAVKYADVLYVRTTRKG